jgi:hypothetical protein
MHLFDIREGVPELDKAAKERFHTFVAKLLYLAKRVRPDILTAVAFLASRVQSPTTDDQAKLDRVMKYLNGCGDLGIVLKPGSEEVSPLAYVDASYGVHSDGKSHSGMLIALGEGPVFVRSAKQRLVTKSSSEAELVALSDETSQVLWSRDFLIAQGYKAGPATVYQDNMSTIAMAQKGKHASARSRHVHVRYFFIKDRIAAGEVDVKYLQTRDMVADILTKPLQGEQFRKLRAALMNWDYGSPRAKIARGLQGSVGETGIVSRAWQASGGVQREIGDYKLKMAAKKLPVADREVIM